MNTLVNADWLIKRLDDPSLIVLDCSVTTTFSGDGGVENSSGRAEYDRGHIPSAGFADLLGALCDTSKPIEFALPTPERFCAALGSLGVGDNSRVVLYDRSVSGWAARVWWMLRWVGFDQAAILDGGLPNWTSKGYPLSTEAASQPLRRLTPRTRSRLIADDAEVLAAIDDDAVHLIDAMPADHFRGEWTLYDRPGHIPGASNVSVLALTESSGLYRPRSELDLLFEGDRNERTITYCGGGIAASSTAFVLTRLGFTDVAVYTASLQEWAADPGKPLVLGA